MSPNNIPVEVFQHLLAVFKKNLPRVQAYYAVKANSNQKIIETLFNEGASFDVASYNEFMQVYKYIKILRKRPKTSISGTKSSSRTPSRTRTL
jgi:diaminopimelate decarboxylase